MLRQAVMFVNHLHEIDRQEQIDLSLKKLKEFGDSKGMKLIETKTEQREYSDGKGNIIDNYFTVTEARYI